MAAENAANGTSVINLPAPPAQANATISIARLSQFQTKKDFLTSRGLVSLTFNKAKKEGGREFIEFLNLVTMQRETLFKKIGTDSAQPTMMALGAHGNWYYFNASELEKGETISI